MRASRPEEWWDTSRHERARIVGLLARRFGDLGLAEDAVQEALAAAAARWPIDGLPERPGAWLTTTAYRKAIGMLRTRRPTVELDGARADQLGVHRPNADEPVHPADDDDLLVLVLTCCHPALDTASRVALTLRHVCGLSVGQIASAFLVGESAMAKRLVRARDKIRRAGMRFVVPAGEALESRLDDVRLIVYLTFNEGYLASDDQPPIRAELCDEAIWLARQLHQVRPDDETAGLLALLLVLDARRAAREDPTGRLVPFAEQSRDGWDHAAIDEARRVMSTTTGRDVGKYQLEATISLLHVSGDRPNWARIADVYALLSRIERSPVVDVNRALAVGYAHGPAAGLAILDDVERTGALGDDYTPRHAVRAELLELAGHPDEARAAWERARDATTNRQQRAELQRRVDRLPEE